MPHLQINFQMVNNNLAKLTGTTLEAYGHDIVKNVYNHFELAGRKRQNWKIKRTL